METRGTSSKLLPMRQCGAGNGIVEDLFHILKVCFTSTLVRINGHHHLLILYKMMKLKMKTKWPLSRREIIIYLNLMVIIS